MGDNLAQRFEALGLADPTAAALCFLADGGRDERRWSRGELLLRTQMVTGHLRDVAAPGSRIVLMFDSGLEFVAAFIGCLRAGLIAVPVAAPQPHLRDHAAAALGEIIRDCSPDAVLTRSEWLAMAAGPAGMDGVAGAPLWLDYDAFELDRRDEACSPRRADDIAFLQYTSGSTGNPKGVMISHGNLHDNIALIARRTLQWDERATIVSWLPMYHDLGLIGGLLHALYTGAQFVFMAPRHFLSRPTRWLEAMTRHRGAFSGAPNFAYELLLRIPDGRLLPDLDLSHWRVASNCAEPVRAATMTAFVDRFARFGLPPTVFAPCYGLAESTVMVTAAMPGRGPVVRDLAATGAGDPMRASSGTPGGSGAIAIVDPETSCRVADGVVGEIWASGDSVALGYWNKPATTRDVFHARIAGDARRWLRTGDLGRVIDDELFVDSRLKDLIIVRGKSIHPSDVEDLVQSIDPRLKRGAGMVIGIEDACDGEAIVVVQETRAADPAALTELAAAIRREVARVTGGEVRDVLFVGAGRVPKTANGKLRRKHGRELYLRGELAARGQIEERPLKVAGA